MSIILKTGPENFFVNENDSISMKYDPHINKYFKYGGKQVSSKDIFIQDGGQIIFKDQSSEKYIIDDGYRCKLVSAGYMTLAVESNTNIDIEEDKSLTIRELILKAVRDNPKYIKDNPRNSIFYMETKYDHDFIIEIESINRLIDRNLRRQKLGLPLYPTERGHDKRGLYFRIYSLKNNNENSIILRPDQIRSIGSNIFKDLQNNILDSNWETIKIILDPESKISHNPYCFIINECPVKRTIIRYETEL